MSRLDPLTNLSPLAGLVTVTRPSAATSRRRAVVTTYQTHMREQGVTSTKGSQEPTIKFNLLSRTTHKRAHDSQTERHGRTHDLSLLLGNRGRSEEVEIIKNLAVQTPQTGELSPPERPGNSTRASQPGSLRAVQSTADFRFVALVSCARHHLPTFFSLVRECLID
jgi:hypothetical protein